MITSLTLFTDGAFQFHLRNPGFGWVAVGEDEKPIARGSGSVKNDGSNNFAGEAAAALAALEYAVAQGVKVIRLCTDFATLEKHMRGTAPRRDRAVAQRLRAFVVAHPEIELRVEKVSSKHPFLEVAHHLARGAING